MQKSTEDSVPSSSSCLCFVEACLVADLFRGCRTVIEPGGSQDPGAVCLAEGQQVVCVAFRETATQVTGRMFHL